MRKSDKEKRRQELIKKSGYLPWETSGIKRVINKLPFRKEFLERLELVAMKRGVLESPDGLFLKVGELLWGNRAPPLTFRKSVYGSKEKAYRAAVLHALFYKDLVAKGLMPPGTMVVIHASSRGSPALSVVQKKLVTSYHYLQGNYLKKEYPYLIQRTRELRKKMFDAYPGLEELSAEDVLETHNYSHPGSQQEFGDALAAGGAGGIPLYYYDLHVFEDNHSKRTRKWLEERFGKKADEIIQGRH